MITRISLPAALILLGCFANSVTAVVTSDQPGSHLTTPGELAFGVNIDGVVLIGGSASSETISDLLPLCTGALITDRHILTAAHCFDEDEDGVFDFRFSFPHVAAFELADRTVMLSINTGEGSVRLPDEWPDVRADLAVIELQEDAPAEVPRYPLYGGTNEVGRRFVLVGYGKAGHGATGENESFDEGPTKRAGMNRYENNETPNSLGIPGGEVDYLVYDFDSGLEENNALAQFVSDSDLGFGDDEVLESAGDSGAPNLIYSVIAGVSSFTTRLPSADVTEENDRSWGEGGFDVRVSKFRDFILDATGNAALFVPDGDFDHDGILTASDIDRLSARTNEPVYEEEFDLNLDQLVDSEDRRIWVEDLAGTLFGDADLSHAVQFNDFLVLANAFGDQGGWAAGDFDGSGNVQFPDFLLLSSNFGKSATTVAAVPEPNAAMVLLVGFVGLALRWSIVSKTRWA